MGKEQINWLAIEGEYRAGVLSNRALEKKYGVSEAAIRKRAKKEGWTKDGAQTRREIVNAHFIEAETSPKQSSPSRPQRSRSTVNPETVRTPDEVKPTAEYIRRVAIARAASDDIDDMELALENARSTLHVIKEYLDTQFVTNMETGRMPDPRSLKAVIDANGAAIDQIRRIRNLDPRFPDELEAIKHLANAGLLPEPMLLEIFQQYRRFKTGLRTALTGHEAS